MDEKTNVEPFPELNANDVNCLMVAISSMSSASASSSSSSRHSTRSEATRSEATQNEIQYGHIIPVDRNVLESLFSRGRHHNFVIEAVSALNALNPILTGFH